MPYLAINQRNNVNILSFYAVDADGYLYDTDVTYAVFDSSGTQVYPASGTEDAANEDVGVYWAYDNSGGYGFTPTTSLFTAGQTYTITWYYVDENSDSQTWSQDFTIVEAGLGIPYWTYITPADVRAAGISAAILPNTRLLSLIKLTQSYIERRCRQPFRPVRHTAKVPGNNANKLLFDVPIIGVESISIYDNVMDAGTFKVYNIPTHGSDPGWLPTDNRGNPKIQLAEEPSLFSGTLLQRYGRIPVGTANVSVKGIWGCLEPDGTTPEAIKMAMLYIIAANADPPTPGVSGVMPPGPVIRERTDLHEIEYGQATKSQIIAAPFVKSPEAEEMLRAWKGPLMIDAPVDWQAPVVRDERSW